MTKIIKVVLRGFKSHINSVFNYSPGLTVVTGPTDSGKSAGVMQPIRWVAFGEPSGEAFIFTIRDPKTKEIVHQAEAVGVEIHLDDESIITKSRRKGKTAYYINNELISEKAEVPQEVKDILGLSKTVYGDFETSLNFAYQLEAPFLISETGSIGAKVLGKLAGTEIVDKAIAAIMKHTHKARDEKSTAQKIIDQVNVELVEYLQVDELKKEIEACETLLEQLDRDTVRVDLMDKLATSYKVLSDKIGSCNTLLDQLKVIHNLIDELTVVEFAQGKYEKISLLDLELNRKIASIKDLEKSLEDYKCITKAAKLLEVTEHSYNTLELLKKLKATYQGLGTKIADNENVIARCRDLGKCGALLDNLEMAAARARMIKSQSTYLNTLDAWITQMKDRIKSFSSIPETYGILDKVIADFDRLSKLQSIKTEYNNKRQAAVSAESVYIQKCAELQEAEKELNDAWESAGGYCPVCEQSVVIHDQEAHI